MKKIYLLMVALFGVMGFSGYSMDARSNASGVPYRPFVEDGKSWLLTYSYAHGWMPVFKAERYYIDGDTLVGEQQCKKLMLRVNDYENKLSETTLYRLLFEKDRKVYYYPATADASATEPIMLYDFSAKVGDEVTLGGIEDTDLTETRRFQIWSAPLLEWRDEKFNGQLATYYDPNLTEEMVLPYTEEVPLFKWYEAIGSIEHPFIKTNWNVLGSPLLLRECRVGGKVIYMDGADAAMFPDVNGDAAIDIEDLNIVVNAILRIADPAECPAANLNGDGKVDVEDVNALINIILKLE